MRYASVAICLLALCLATVAEANNNSKFTVVLHAGTPGGGCSATGVPDCAAVQPVTTVAPGTEFRLYILVNNYTELQAMQTCLSWPADWLINPAGEPTLSFPCAVGATAGHEPQGDGQGPGGNEAVDGTYAASFNCITGPAVAKIVRIDFRSGASGCLTQINPAQGSGRVEIDDCAVNPPGGNPTLLDASTAEGQARLGSICVGTPGHNACQAIVAVEPATWGRIKNSYR
jgi:hypothetical protein